MQSYTAVNLYILLFFMSITKQHEPDNGEERQVGEIRE